MEPSQDSPTTETQHGSYFLDEWVTGLFYGDRWHDVKEGTFKEGIQIQEFDGEMCVYQDPFNDDIIFLTEPLSGYRVKKPAPPPPPPEPKASVTELHPKK